MTTTASTMMIAWLTPSMIASRASGIFTLSRTWSRVDPNDVADNYPDVPLLGFTNHTDTTGLRAAHAAGVDQVVAKSALFERTQELIGGLLTPVE